MELSDRQEPVNVTLSVEDWGIVVAAMNNSRIPLLARERINSEIFQCARRTERIAI